MSAIMDPTLYRYSDIEWYCSAGGIWAKSVLFIRELNIWRRSYSRSYGSTTDVLESSGA